MQKGNSELYKIALTKIDSIGAVLTKQLVSYCGGIEAVFEQSKKQLLKIPKIGPAAVNKILSTDALKNAEKEQEFIHKENISYYFYLDEGYPSRLKHYPDSPVMIYYKGTLNLENRRTVGIIGTRQPSEVGKLNCEKLVEDLKAYDVYVISGLAHGIDATAHKASVHNKVPTIGVLGHGLQMMYPAQHRSLATKMLDEGGAIITEFGHTTIPDRPNFPMRNRIIAALSDALVVVESARKGGSIITAIYANEYNKDVFAFPGRIQDEKAQGCNMLIKQHKAALMESAADIGYIMNWEEDVSSMPTQASLFLNLLPEEQAIIDCLKEHKQLSADQLHYRLKMPHSRLSSILLNLEFNGILKSLPGKKYILYT